LLERRRTIGYRYDLKSNIQVSVVGEQGIVLCYGGGQKKSI
jgi:hypothetical protein